MDEDLKNKIRELLRHERITRSELARRIEIGVSYLGAVLVNPDKGLSATIIKNIIAYGVNPLWFFGINDDAPILLKDVSGEKVAGITESSASEIDWKVRAEEAEKRIADLENKIRKLQENENRLLREQVEYMKEVVRLTTSKTET